MKIAKTTFNMAKKRGLELELGTAQDKLGRDFPALMIHGHWQSDAVAFYRIKEDGLQFDGCHYGEDWPCWIRSDKHLRSLLDAMAEALLQAH